MQAKDAPHPVQAQIGQAQIGQAQIGQAPIITALDGLRGCAALIVLLSHYSNSFDLWHGLLGNGAGQTGIMLFFMLSGFLMAHIHIDTNVTLPHVWNYAVRRIARVYPLFVFVAAALALQPFVTSFSAPEPETWVSILRQISFIDPGASILWTIRVEVTFYVVFVGIWWMHARLGNRYATVGLLVVILALLRFTWLGIWGVFLPTCRFFFFGTITALLMPRKQGAPSATMSALSLLLFGSLPFTFPLVAREVFHASIESWNSDIVAGQIILIFNLIVRRPGLLCTILSTRIARWLGRVSYSLYLLQPFVISFVLWRIGTNRSQAVSGAAVLFGVLLAAQLSHRLLELPTQSLIMRAGYAIPSMLRRRICAA